MAGVTNAEIMEKLGQLSGSFESVRRELDQATEGRRRTYEKIEETVREVAGMRNDLNINAATVGQVREEVKALASAQRDMTTSIQPLLDLRDKLPAVVEGWTNLRGIGSRLVWLLTIGGFSVAGIIWWLGGMFTVAIQHWLGIDKLGPPAP